MILAFPGASLWLWHLLGLFYDCDTSWGLSDSDTSSFLYNCGTSWKPLWLWHFLGLSMIVALPGVCLWLWHFLVSMIVALSGVPLWLWYFLGHLFDCDTSWGFSLWNFLGFSMIVTLPGDSVIVTPPGGLSMNVTLPRASLWLWHILGFNCDSLGPNIVAFHGTSMIVTLPVASLRDTNWGLSRIVVAKHFLGHLYDYELPGASIWLWHFIWRCLYNWHFLGPFYDYDTS